MQQADPEGEKNGPKDQGTKDPPEKDFMMVNVREFEIIENKEENEKVVEAQGPFQDIAGQELQGRLFSFDKINAPIKEKSDRDPDHAPEERFFHPDFVSFAVENTQVQREHHKDHRTEDGPGKDVNHQNSGSLVWRLSTLTL
jgi:hypothetical protein